MSTSGDVGGNGVILGTIVNPAGLTLAKTVPASGVGRFTDPGLGASPTWHGFAIDRVGIAFTDDISVVGDQRVRIDADALRAIDDGLGWAPASFFDQDGNPLPTCTRGTLGACRIPTGEGRLERSYWPRNRVSSRRLGGTASAG